MTPPRKIAPHERQLSLLVRLLDAERPLTAQAVLGSVDGYREAAATARPGTLEKLFERDRAALAELGVEVETVPDPVVPNDRARWRYRLAEAPDTRAVKLSADETLLVDRASRVWAAPDIATSARRAYFKLLGVGDPQADPAVTAPSAQLSTDPAFGPLTEAIARRRIVEFDYVKAGAHRAERRRVVPLRLVVVDGRWLCNCHDLDREAERNFLVARIVGEIDDVGERGDDGLAARTDLPAALAALAREQPARIAVRLGSEAQSRLAPRALDDDAAADAAGGLAEGPGVAAPGDSAAVLRDGWPVLEVPSWDHELLADELAGLGAQVRVVAPPALADAVRRRLEHVLAEHAGGGPGEAAR